MKEVFILNFNHYLKINNLTPKEFSRQINKPYTTILDWCKGNSFPRPEAMQMISDYFGIRMSELTDYSWNEQEASKSLFSGLKTMRNTVHVYGRIPAGTPFEAIEQRLDDVSIPDKLAHKKGLFGLEIVGDSMNKIIPDGAIGVFQKCCEVNPGDAAVIMVNGDDATVKHFYKLKNGCLLEPDSYNDEHKPRIISESDGIDVKIIGKLLWYCVDFTERR